MVVICNQFKISHCFAILLKIDKIMSRFYFLIKTRYRSVDFNTARSAISLVYPKILSEHENRLHVNIHTILVKIYRLLKKNFFLFE